MWEWSNRLRKPSTRKTTAKSLLAAYNDLVLQNSARPAPLATPAETEMIGRKERSPELKIRHQLELRLREHNLRMELKERPYEPQTWPEMNDCFSDYLKNRALFLKQLGYSYADECRRAGMTNDDIALLRQSIAPENFNTHLKIPFDFGGALDFENFSLVKTHPVHCLIHRLIDWQIENHFLRSYKKIFLPWFEGKIYYD